MENIFEIETSKITQNQSKNYNALVFAFVGDAVFSLYVRNYFACSTTAKAGILHSKTSGVVRAKSQAFLLDVLQEQLTEEENQIVHQARNIHTKNIAKNSNIEEYKKSTSFEAVVGFLYLTNKTDRLNEILEICKKYFDNLK